MALMHHDRFPDGTPGLRVNARAVDDEAAMEIYAEAGWQPGPHRDTDPDDPSEVPAVLPAKTTPLAAKAASKKAS